MDRLSALMIRASLAWLVAGVLVGAALLSLEAIGHPGWPGIRLAHVHALLVGWLVQFAIGVAYWLFPRRRTEAQPLGYDERRGWFAWLALNLGLGLRAAVEPVFLAGAMPAGLRGLLMLSALAQAGAVVIFALDLWPRAARRPART